MNDLEQLRAFLASQSTLTLATVSRDGTPHATPLFFLLHGGLQLYWLSAPSTTHSLNLAHRSQVSAAIHTATDHWKQIRGVQMQGSAQPVSNPQERQTVLEDYKRRFRLEESFNSLIARTVLYKFIPSRLTYIDNSRGFGHTQVFSLPPIAVL